jgi:hypothetical protein
MIREMKNSKKGVGGIESVVVFEDGGGINISRNDKTN